jgi:FAD/FMN-containing dehydrogenase
MTSETTDLSPAPSSPAQATTQAAAHQTWVDKAADSLTPYALPGGYPNLLGPDDHAQITLAYGPNTDRLRAAKARFDPESVFSATPLPN